MWLNKDNSVFAPYLGDRLYSTASPILVLHINVLFDLRCSDALLDSEILASGAVPGLITHTGLSQPSARQSSSAGDRGRCVCVFTWMKISYVVSLSSSPFP